MATATTVAKSWDCQRDAVYFYGAISSFFLIERRITSLTEYGR